MINMGGTIPKALSINRTIIDTILTLNIESDDNMSTIHNMLDLDTRVPPLLSIAILSASSSTDFDIDTHSYLMIFDNVMFSFINIASNKDNLLLCWLLI